MRRPLLTFLYMLASLGFIPSGFVLGQTTSIKQDIRIAWDYGSVQQIAEKGGYPRLIRLKDSTLFVVYETYSGNIHFKKSLDNGKTWSAATEVFSQFVYTALNGESTVVNMSNPEIKQLQNGDLILACNYRPRKAEIAPYVIVIKRSTDNGKTWTAPQSLYAAAPRFKDGCWEPSLLQLPNGELQVYFANENPYRNSDEQEISMLSSTNNGISWSAETKTVSFRQNRRDGMPVPALFNEEIVVTIEDNKTDQFKPYTVRTKVSDNWLKPVLADDENRNYALNQTITDSVYMGAPYLLKLPGGQALLSYQTNENRAHNWELSTLEVAIGDKNARNFGNRTRPFDIPINKEAKWNSIALWDHQTIVALASTNFKSKNIAPWLIKGHIIPEIKLKNSKIEDYPIFIGAKSSTNLKSGLTYKEASLSIKSVVSTPNKGSEKNNTDLFLKINNNVYKIWVSESGKTKLFIRKKGEWIPNKMDKNIAIKVNPTTEGYTIDYQIYDQLLGKRQLLKELSIAFAISAVDENGKSYLEYLANTEEKNTQTWINILL